MKSILLLPLALLLPANAERLSTMAEKPWLGWFSGIEERNFRFGVNGKGDGVYIPMKGRNEVSSPRDWIELAPTIQHVLPDGRVVTKTVDGEGFGSQSGGGAGSGTVSYSGTVTGGARFEANFEVDGKEVLAGGRVVDKGTLTDGTLRFVVQVKVPGGYPYERDEDKLEKAARRDKIEFAMVDGKTLKFDALEEVDGKDITTGIKEADVDFDGYRHGDMEISAGENGYFLLDTRGPRSLYKGFTLNWTCDPAKDPQGEARLRVTVK